MIADCTPRALGVVLIATLASAQDR